MATILEQHVVGDGYDVRILADNGQAYVLHFISQPTQDAIDAKIAEFEASLVPDTFVVYGEED